MNKKTLVALLMLLPLMACALLGPWLAPHDPEAVELAKKFLPPDADHLLGTDHLGRDILSRLMVGARYSLSTVLYIIACIVAASLALGSVAGYLGGRADSAIMRVCDAMMTFPTIVLALFLIGILGAGLTNLVIAIAVTHVAWYTRLVRSHVLSLKSRGHILAAQAMGLSRTRIVIRHFLPAITVQVLVLATLDVGHMLLHVAGLSFLGLGIQPPTPEWGLMISEARNYIRSQPMLMFYPGMMIFMATAACNLMGDALRDRLDPALRAAGA